MPDSDAYRRAPLLLGLIAFESSLRLVPADPHAGQCAAGARAGQVSIDTARAVYAAMLAAAEDHF